MHHKFHLGVDVAADREGSSLRKAFGKSLAGRFLVGVEQAHDIDLMNEIVLVSESEAVAPVDGDFAWMEGTSALANHMVVGKGRRRGHQQACQDDHFHGCPLPGFTIGRAGKEEANSRLRGSKKGRERGPRRGGQRAAAGLYPPTFWRGVEQPGSSSGS